MMPFLYEKDTHNTKKATMGKSKAKKDEERPNTIDETNIAH